MPLSGRGRLARRLSPTSSPLLDLPCLHTFRVAFNEWPTNPISLAFPQTQRSRTGDDRSETYPEDD
jgi:hypothetical protein